MNRQSTDAATEKPGADSQQSPSGDGAKHPPPHPTGSSTIHQHFPEGTCLHGDHPQTTVSLPGSTQTARAVNNNNKDKQGNRQYHR